MPFSWSYFVKNLLSLACPKIAAEAYVGGGTYFQSEHAL